MEHSPALVCYTQLVAVVSGHGLEKSFGDRTILAGVNLTVESGERVGMVGANGSGKTTLARILAGVSEADGGEVRRARDSRIAYLAQEPHMDGELSALEVVLGGLGEYALALERHAEIADALESASNAQRDKLLREQAAVGERVELLGGWDLSHRAARVLDHLGIRDAQLPVGPMSGGERRRIALARILVSEPDLAILDEPTNHLDITTIEWLERFLIDKYQGAVLLITHDRYLLDRVVSRTLEVDRGAVHSYDGGWQEYLEARATRAAHQAKVEANRQNFLRRELEWLRRQPKARTTKSKSRVDRAEAALNAGPQREGPGAAIRVESVRSGKTILEARELGVDIGGHRLVRDFEVTLRAGQRVGIIGPNGAGKTTLLRVLLGELEPACGTVRRGSNTRVAYLDQARAGLDGDASVYDNVAQGASHVTVDDRTIEVRAYLYKFLFDNTKQKQPVGTLSGGERARVALARVLREKANLVVLDEPTNDLDATTLSALEESLLEFGGTSIVVTHDRWFLDRVATDLIAFEGDGELVMHAGSYSEYREWKRASERAADRKPNKPPVPESPSPNPPQQTKKGLTYGEEIELGGLMEAIETAEAHAAELEAETTHPDFSLRPYPEQAAKLESLTAARAEADKLVERWSELEAKKG